MRKIFLFVLSALLVLGLSAQVGAEQSPSTATGNRLEDNQVFTIAFNNSGSALTSHSVVILDTTATATSTLGAYITTTATADDYRVFGIVADESCASEAGCRVIIRGPALVLDADSTHAAGAILATSTTAGVTTTYATADGTTGGYLGHVIGATSSLGANYAWVWVNPQIHD